MTTGRVKNAGKSNIFGSQHFSLEAFISIWWYVYESNICTTWALLLEGFQNDSFHFCSLDIDQVMLSLKDFEWWEAM